MPGIAKLHLEDSLEDGPQTKGLLNLFEKDAASLKKYTVGLHNCCQRILSAQNELCAATQSLAQQLRSYELQKFPLEPDDSILTSTLKQFATYLDDVSSVQQVLAAQFSETMMFPVSKFLQNDVEEVSTMFELFQIATDEHEQAMGKYMKLSKKKDNDRLRREVNEELYTSRKKFHQTALHYYASLNALQYKRKCFLLEPILGYMHAQRAFFQMGQESVGKGEIEDFLSNIATSVQGVQHELNQETQKTVDLIDTLENQSSHLYHPEPLIEMPYIPPNTALICKAGYLFMRSKQSLIATKWERSYFFTQGGNLMCQTKEEVAGSVVLDLNDDGLVAEIADVDDRRFGFTIHVPHSKKCVYLQAENERERDEWISTINNIVRNGKPVKGKPAETTTKKIKENEQNNLPVHLKVEWIEPSEQDQQTSSVPDKCQESWNEMELKLPKVEILSDNDSCQELPPEFPNSALQNHDLSSIYSHQDGRNSEYGSIVFNQNQYPNFSSFCNTLAPESNRTNIPLNATFEDEEKVFNFQNFPNQEQMRRQGLFNNPHHLLTSENNNINENSEELNEDDEPLIWEPEMPAEHDYLDSQDQPIGTGLEAVLPGSDLYYEIVQTHENLTFPNSSIRATQSRLQFLEKLKTKMQNKIAYYDKNKLTVKCSNNSDEKRVWDKQHFCMYCRRGSTNLAKHILHCHKNEEEVIGILQCNLRSKQRVYLLDKLRFIGDYMHNMDVLKKEAGVIIAWRSPPDPVPVSNFVPCQHCLAFFQRKDLLRHDRTCKFRPRHRDNQINLKDLLSQSSLLLPVSYRIQRQMAGEVLTVLPDDPLSRVVKNDDLILKFGSKLYQQVSHVPNCPEMVCESMRELSQLVIDIQSKDPSVDSLADCINPERFSFVVSCVRGVCNKKKPGQVSGMVSEHMLRLGRMLLKCALILKSDAILSRQLDRRESAESFHWLCEMEWGQRSQSFLLN